MPHLPGANELYLLLRNKNAIQAVPNPGFCMHSVEVNGSPNTMGDQTNIISHNAMELFITIKPQKQLPFQDV